MREEQRSDATRIVRRGDGRGLFTAKFLLAATAAARGICRERFERFGCAGQADRLKPVALERMATRYATAA